MTLGERIYRLRADRNMTQEQLAEKLRVTRQSISKWEGDLVKPEIEKLKAMAKLFEVSLDDLISDEASDKKDKEEKTITEDSLNKKTNRNKIIITVIACLLIIAMTVTIIVMINLSHRVRTLEMQSRPYVIDGNEESDKDTYFSELEWKVADVDKENMTADIYILLHSPKTIVTIQSLLLLPHSKTAKPVQAGSKMTTADLRGSSVCR